MNCSTKFSILPGDKASLSMLILAIAFLLGNVSAKDEQPKNISGRASTILFLDDRDVLFRSGTLRRVIPFKKYSENPVIAPDKPWESEAIGWCSQLKNPVTGKFQIWYQGYTQRDGDKRFKSVVCYAESDDGRTWTKPKLGLFDFYGEKDTNIVLIGSGGIGDRYCNSVIFDSIEQDPAKRYKMMYSDWALEGEGKGKLGVNLYAAFSPDGIHWTKQIEPVLALLANAKGLQAPYVGEDVYSEKGSGKGIRRTWRIPFSMSDAADLIYDKSRNAYVLYGKMWVSGPDGGLGWKHGMGRTQSKDFKTWEQPELLLTTDDKDAANLEFHTSPVFIYNGIYVSLNQLMNRDAGTIDLELMSSRDGFHWDRLLRGTNIIPRGTGAVFDAGAIASNASPIVVGDEIRFYYSAYRYPMTGGIARWPTRQVIGSNDYISGIGYAYTRRDRFVSLSPDPSIKVAARKNASETTNTIGSVTLRALDLEGITKITVNANAAQGTVKVEILDQNGYRLPGFTKDDATPLAGDKNDHEATWRGKSVRDLPAGRYLIRIHLDGADLFAITLQ